MNQRYASIFRADLFAGQVVLITGGGTGIGRCIAHEMASLGATVVLAARRSEPLVRTVGEITDDGGRADWLELNIRDEEQVDQALQDVVARHGKIDHLVNNAGGQFVSEAESIRPKGWRAVIDTNLNGTFWVTQAAFRHWMGSHGGAVVSIVADVWNGFPGLSHTGAARAGVINLTQSLAIEWAQHGVRVNAVAPGGILSSGLGNYPEEVQEVAMNAMKQVPAARLGTEAEVSSAVVYLLSPGAAYVTGATLRVDGGGSLSKIPMFPLAEHTRMPAFQGFHRDSAVPGRFRS